MANEGQMRSSLSIDKGNKHYRSPPSSFRADVEGSKGPTPGTLLVTTDGVDIDSSAVDRPGLTYIGNEDDTNTVHLGVWNPDQAEFYGVLSWRAGEGYSVRLFELLNQEWAGTGTGTTDQTNTLRLKAENAPCLVRVDINDA